MLLLRQTRPSCFRELPALAASAHGVASGCDIIPGAAQCGLARRAEAGKATARAGGWATAAQHAGALARAKATGTA